MQAGITKELLSLSIAFIVLPSILVLLMPLIDRIITDDVIEFINDTIDNIEFFIGSTNTTILFGIIGIIIVMPLIRRFFSFFEGKQSE